jgi:hypothetical protein
MAAQDHGVLAVVFSVLAIAFLFDIDDKLMGVWARRPSARPPARAHARAHAAHATHQR